MGVTAALRVCVTQAVAADLLLQLALTLRGSRTPLGSVDRRPTPGLTCTDGSSALAEGVGFEPTRSKLLAVFKTAAIGH